MARINDGTFRDWKNGDTISSDGYEQDREIIRTAINVTDDKVKEHEDKLDGLDVDVRNGLAPRVEDLEEKNRLTIEPALASLEDEVYVQHEGRISDAEQEIYGLKQGNIPALTNRMDSLEDADASQDTRLSVMETDVYGTMLPVTFAGLEQQNQTFYDYEVGYLNNKLVPITEQLAEKMKKGDLVVSVKDYGAKGDGVTDDTLAVKEAIAFCNSTFSTLVFPKGTYLISEPILITGGYAIIGNQSKVKYNSTTLIEDFVTVSIALTQYSQIGYGKITHIDNIEFDSNGYANQCLRVYEGKLITLTRVYTVNPLKKSCYIGNTSGKQTWELTIENCVFSANNPTGYAEYALYASGAISDSYLNNIYAINGTINWAYLDMSASAISNIHGYSYPENLACDVGFNVYIANTTLTNIICDTPKYTGLLLRGVGGIVRNVSGGKFQSTDRENKQMVMLQANDMIIDGVAGGDVIGVVVDTATNVSIVDAKIRNLRGTYYKDIVVTGKIPYRFEYDNKTNILSGGASLKNNQFLFLNQYMYAGTAPLNITFKYPLSSATYTVDIYEVTGKHIPSHVVKNVTTTGFTIETLERTETLNLKIKVTMD